MARARYKCGPAAGAVLASLKPGGPGAPDVDAMRHVHAYVCARMHAQFVARPSLVVQLLPSSIITESTVRHYLQL